MVKNCQGKLLRVQGPRSQSGCLTCKLRHVKCDESTPVCGKCLRGKRNCRYASNEAWAAKPQFVVYSMVHEPGPSLKLAPYERRALWHFQHRTIEHIEGSFRSELWSTIVPQMVQHDPIVRQAVLALSTFHENYLDRNSTTSALPGDALHFYRKARRQIIGLDSPDDYFDSILCAAIIFCTCEGLQGNFQESTQHAWAGMKMIAARQPCSPQAPLVFTSKTATLANIFLDLQDQVMEANDDDNQLCYAGLDQQLRDVPDRFDDSEKALSYLLVFMEDLFDLYQKTKLHHETNIWIPLVILPALQPDYDSICRRFRTWKDAVYLMEASVRGRDRRQRASNLLLKIYAMSVEVDLYVYLHGEAAYDECKEIHLNTLSLIEEYLQSRVDEASSGTTSTGSDNCSSFNRKCSSFTSSPEVVPILFEIATRTNDLESHRRALQLLRSANRQESIWDSRVFAVPAEKIVQLKQQGDVSAAYEVPGYRFLITDIKVVSARDCVVKYGFKKIVPGRYENFYMDTIQPGEGSLYSKSLTID